MTGLRQGSFRIFHAAGINVYLHWSWFIIALIEINARQRTYSSPFWNVLEYLSLFAIVTTHEFGHALGCIHEHQSPTENLKWDKEAVYAAFSGPPNFWSRADIDSNILQKYSAAGMSTTPFYIHSIMLYQFDASLFLDHVGTPLNTDLSDMDKNFIGQMYPR